MADCPEEHHNQHAHKHGQTCGHTAIRHNGHVDYVHDGHLHHPHDGHVDEHVIEVSETAPVRCTPENQCHRHGHTQTIPHGDHVDYLVNGRLHHPHEGHCDDHGAVDEM